MENKERVLHLDICDYNRNVVCHLYDNSSNVSGQAVDIFVSIERNGWKELSFTLPSMCMTESGNEQNYRLDYLKADYLVRLIDDTETDWFIISEPKISHNNFAKNCTVTAGHIAQLLKLKNLGLEFSDDQGNNVGTAAELANTILEGTGWTTGYIYPFAEKDGSTKYRSLKASAKTGAFKLIASVCDLFDAKPLYHGDSRTVDIVPLNPFSEPDPGQPPSIPDGSEVVELHYGKNVSNVTRTLNTENIVTKLYAYGAYGDKTNGYCGIDECLHAEYFYTLSDACNADQTYYFSYTNDSGNEVKHHFTPNYDISAGSVLIYSLLDPSSSMYIWDTQNNRAYVVKSGAEGEQLPVSESETKMVQNWFQFIMDYNYYYNAGLLTDEMLQIIADYQRTAPPIFQNINEAAQNMADAQTILSETIGVIDFCKLDIAGINASSEDDYVSLVLNKANFPDGVIYRTDYTQNKDNYFEWNYTESLNTDGDPINPAASVLYIIHNTNPVTWNKIYLKNIDNKDDPSIITLWTTNDKINIDVNSDQFFLFSYNGINGRLGALESNDEAALMALEESLRVVTVDHPVIFTKDNPSLMPIEHMNGYGWAWRYYAGPLTFRTTESEMYFAYTDEGDTHWNFVYFTDSDPGGAEENAYWYDWRNAVLYRRKNAAWHLLDTAVEKKVAATFSTVYTLCKARDRYYQGLHENYTYTVPNEETLPVGNYYFKNEYDSYWAFTTTNALNAGDTIVYNYDDAWITQTKDGVENTLKPKGYRFDNVGYHVSNILNGRMFESGGIDPSDGSLLDDNNKCRTQSLISVVPSTKYDISGTSIGVSVNFYDDNKNWLSSVESSSSFTTAAGCSFIRLSVNTAIDDFSDRANMVISANNASNMIIIEDLNYTYLPTTTGDSEIIGLVQCVEKFTEYANHTYDVLYGKLKEAQDIITSKEKNMTATIGDLYREGWWQDLNYVDGDEDKLYADAMDNLIQIAKPEATYSINYLDLFTSNNENDDYGAAEETIKTKWPDLSINSAAHLIDPEIDVNTWAFIDKIQKCYDKPWQTKIAINTNLSTIAQHSFTDVMSNIANVSSEIKGKASYYDKTLDIVATTSALSNVQVGLNKSERDLLSTITKVEQVNGTLVTQTSTFKHTIDEVSSEIMKVSEAEGALTKQMSSFEQTLDEVSSEIVKVSEAEGALTKQMSLFKQTLSGFETQVEDISSKSILNQTADTIRAVVRGDASEGGNQGLNEFNTSSVTINNDGVAISTGGNVSIGAGGFFTVESGNFDLDKNGNLFAAGATINGNLSSGGYPVLTKDYDIYIGSEQPAASVSHIGMLWIKPGVSSGGGGSSEEPSTPMNEKVTFTQSPTFGDRYLFTSAGSTSDGPQTAMLYGNKISSANSGSYTYAVSLPVIIEGRSDGAKTGGTITLSINGGAIKFIWKELEYGAYPSDRYETLKKTISSDIWLGSSSSITATLSVKQHDSGYKTGAWATNPTSPIEITCTA